MADAFYTSGLNWVLENTVDTPGGSGLKIILMQSNYTFSAAHGTVSAITGAGTEVARTNALTGLAINGNELDASASTISSVNNGTVASAALFYDAGTGDANAIPICFYDGLSLVTNGSDVTVTPNASGLFNLTG